MLRTTIGEPQLSQVVKNYRAMGFEVHVEYFGAGSTGNEGGPSCTTSYDADDKSDASQDWGSVYVRAGQSASRSDALL